MSHSILSSDEYQLAAQLLSLATQRKWTIATAESCTGGLLGALLTHFAGSSSVYLGGVITYANDAKVNILGVAPETLANHGAVSAQTVLEMAQGAQRLFGSDLAMTTSGIAGPGGASPGKPVGTIWCGFAYKDQFWSKLSNFDGNRQENRQSTCRVALKTLLAYIEKIDDHSR